MTRHPDSPQHNFDFYIVFLILAGIAALTGMAAFMWSLAVTAQTLQLPTL